MARTDIAEDRAATSCRIVGAAAFIVPSRRSNVPMHLRYRDPGRVLRLSLEVRARPSYVNPPNGVNVDIIREL